MAKRKKRRQLEQKFEAYDSDDDNVEDDEDDGNDGDKNNQPGAATGAADDEDDEDPSHSESSPSGGEEETAYEQSFDGRVVRLGKTFVLRGCPWIKGGEWDAVEAAWDEADDPDALNPTSLLKRYLKEEEINFQVWRQEGFESAVRPTFQTHRSSVS